MSKRGITITNYLIDADPDGIIITNLSNWTGQAIKIPRNLLSDFAKRPELTRPGVYFLLGQDENNPDEHLIYIGESDNVAKRLIQHVRDEKKDFFEEIVVFVSKDTNLNILHVKYLEEQLINIVTKNRLYTLTNKKAGNKLNSSQMIKDEMDTFIDNMKLVLPTLGHKFLDTNDELITTNNDDTLYLKQKGIVAEGVLTSNGFLVKANSGYCKEPTPSLPEGHLNTRKLLEKKGFILTKDEARFLESDYEFASPSQAASVILGASSNGRMVWKNMNGESLKEIEAKKLV